MVAEVVHTFLVGAEVVHTFLEGAEVVHTFLVGWLGGISWWLDGSF